MTETNKFNQIVGFSIDDWQPVLFPPKTIMKGHYCLLEPLEVNKHAMDLYHALSIENQGESWTYLPYGPFITVGEFQEWLHSTKTVTDTLLHVILDVKTHQPIGIAGYLRITPEHGVIEIGHLHFSRLLKQTSAATEAIYLMLQRVFDELGYRRCEWKCNALNQASCNAAERFGFKFEGIFRQNYVYKNRNRDTAWFSIINSEWPTIKEKFQKWLNPKNFDTHGNQIIRLQDI